MNYTKVPANQRRIAEVDLLRQALRDAASKLREAACTCPPDMRGHGSDCQGIAASAQFFDMLEQRRTLTRRDEIFAAGDRLGDRLLTLGADADLMSTICSAFGQRAAMSTEAPDRIADAVVENYKAGRWEKPGPELADRLMVERFGDPPNMREMLVWFSQILAD